MISKKSYFFVVMITIYLKALVALQGRLSAGKGYFNPHKVLKPLRRIRWESSYFLSSFGEKEIADEKIMIVQESNIEPKLIEHIRDQIGQGLARHLLDDSTRKTNLTNHIIKMLLSDSSKAVNNHVFHNAGVLIAQSLYQINLSSLEALANGKITLDDLIHTYQLHEAKSREIFETISSHHQLVAQRDWKSVTEDISSLQQYSSAATAMGNRRWVRESNDWMINYAYTYFRHGNAVKHFMKLHNVKKQDKTHPYQQLSRDLMKLPDDPDPNCAQKIKLLDVGSCYNPLVKNSNSPCFEITALDLYPADNTVYQCDFLQLQIGPRDSAPIIETIQSGNTVFQRIVQLPAFSYDVVSMSLVLSYLSHPQQRELMIEKARQLLRSSLETQFPHYNGLLLIIEKESIFSKVKQVDASTSVINQFYSEWKRAISARGFDFAKYSLLQTTSGRKAHAFAFSTKPQTALDYYYHKQQEFNLLTFGAISRLWIRQDFLTSKSDPCDLTQSADTTVVKVSSSSAKHPSSATKRKPFIKFFPVGIIGGGLGGSALALALQMKGIPFKLFEKDASFDARRQGYALTMQQGGIALRELGIVDQVKEIGVISTGHYSYDATGQLLGAYGYNVSQPAKGKDPKDPMDTSELKQRHNIHIPRQVLRNLLMEKIHPQNVAWNKKLVAISPFETKRNTSDSSEGEGRAEEEGGTGINPMVQEDSEGFRVFFQDGTEESFSIVIGADGVFSQVRQLLKQSTRPGLEETEILEEGNHPSSHDLRYLQLMVILGISDLKSSLDNRSYCQRQWLNGSTRVFTMPYDQDRLMWQLSYPLEEAVALQFSSVEKRNPQEVQQTGRVLKEEAMRRCAGWDPVLLEIFAKTEERNVSGHPVYDRNPADFLVSESPWLSRITLLGDAAHPMSPFKGQGANQALLDALSLSKALISSEFVKPHRRKISIALRDYERDMKSRTEVKVLKSREAAEYLHSTIALATGNITRAKAAEQALYSQTNDG